MSSIQWVLAKWLLCYFFFFVTQLDCSGCGIWVQGYFASNLGYFLPCMPAFDNYHTLLKSSLKGLISVLIFILCRIYSSIVLQGLFWEIVIAIHLPSWFPSLNTAPLILPDNFLWYLSLFPYMTYLYCYLMIFVLGMIYWFLAMEAEVFVSFLFLPTIDMCILLISPTYNIATWFHINPVSA